jgi:hypothetical protein
MTSKMLILRFSRDIVNEPIIANIDRAEAL